MLLVMFGYKDTDEKSYTDARYGVKGRRVNGTRPISCVFTLLSGGGDPTDDMLKDILGRSIGQVMHPRTRVVLCQCIDTQKYIEEVTGRRLDIVKNITPEEY